MEFKGTNTKWQVDNSGYRTKNGGLCIMSGDICLSVVGDGNPGQPIEANALLISKAPEMLKFIQHVYNTMPNGSSLQSKAKELIKESTEL